MTSDIAKALTLERRIAASVYREIARGLPLPFWQMMVTQLNTAADNLDRESARSAGVESIAVNMPFERLPQHGRDPGFGPVPPRPKVEQLFQYPETAPGPAERADDGRTATIADGLGGNDRANIKGNEAMSESTPSSTPSAPQGELRACPFCGLPPKTNSHDGYVSVFCDTPDCVQPETDGRQNNVSIDRWNRRTPPLGGTAGALTFAELDEIEDTLSTAPIPADGMDVFENWDNAKRTPALKLLDDAKIALVHGYARPAPPAQSVEHPIQADIRAGAVLCGMNGHDLLAGRLYDYANELDRLTSRPAVLGGGDALMKAVCALLENEFIGDSIGRTNDYITLATEYDALASLHSPAPVEGDSK